MNPAPTARSGLRETLEDIRQWIKTGMIDDVHYDEASVMAQIDAALAANPVGQATAAKRAELQPTPGMRLIEVRSLAALKRALAVPGAMVRVLENTYLARQPDGQAALDRQKKGRTVAKRQARQVMFEDESWLNFGKTADWEFPGDGTAIYQPITGSQERIVYVVEVPSLG